MNHAVRSGTQLVQVWLSRLTRKTELTVEAGVRWYEGTFAGCWSNGGSRERQEVRFFRRLR